MQGLTTSELLRPQVLSQCAQRTSRLMTFEPGRCLIQTSSKASLLFSVICLLYFIWKFWNSFLDYFTFISQSKTASNLHLWETVRSCSREPSPAITLGLIHTEKATHAKAPHTLQTQKLVSCLQGSRGFNCFFFLPLFCFACTGICEFLCTYNGH